MPVFSLSTPIHECPRSHIQPYCTKLRWSLLGCTERFLIRRRFELGVNNYFRSCVHDTCSWLRTELVRFPVTSNLHTCNTVFQPSPFLLPAPLGTSVIRKLPASLSKLLSFVLDWMLQDVNYVHYAEYIYTR